MNRCWHGRSYERFRLACESCLACEELFVASTTILGTRDARISAAVSAALSMGWVILGGPWRWRCRRCAADSPYETSTPWSIDVEIAPDIVS